MLFAAVRLRGWVREGGILLLGLALITSRSRADEFAAARALLVDACLSCHDPGQRKGDLDLSRRDAALAGGLSGLAAIHPDDSSESYLLWRIEDGEMPPSGPLAPEKIALLRRWVEAGAPYPSEPLAARRAGPDWWSLQPIRRPEVPSVSNPETLRDPIDAFIRARLESSGLAPSPEADRVTYIRRVTFDLTGLPPTPEEIDAFLADESPDAHERLVDRLLASPRYGERWGRHWLDVVRFAESHGYETNQLRMDAWPYRDYVIRAFNEDTPFGRFVAEQLAGDQLPEGDWLVRAATGFLVGGTHDVVGNQTEEGTRRQRADDLDDIITATGTTFLGLTVNCARCHDHKFDPIGQEDYYGLAAVFSGVQHSSRQVPTPDADRRRREADAIRRELARIDRDLDAFEPLARPSLGDIGRPMVNARRNVERIEPTEARFLRVTVFATSNGIEPCIDELEAWTAGPEPRNVALATAGAVATASSTYPNSDIHRLEHINDDRYGNSRSWISAVPGKGTVEIAFADLAVIDRVVWGRDREERYRDRIPTHYTIELGTEPGHWRVVASSADRAVFDPEATPDAEIPGLSTERIEQRDALRRRRGELRERLNALGETTSIYAGTFAEPGPTHLLRRGDPMQPERAVVPSGVRSVGPTLVLDPATPEAERRLALARWIADPANPLPPRVMVNRLWHYHFGQGIVATPSDFGYNGGTPSHPELLDWLAAEFLDNGGHLKPLHRRIVLSATYRQSTAANPEALAVDASNRLLWRMTPRRLEAESIRDAILAVAGTLDDRMDGPGYNVWKPNTNYVAVFTPKDELGPAEWRRMVYMFRPRSRLDTVFGAFDCPDGGLVAPRRNASTTALQALNLLNSDFVLDQADRFAERLTREAGTSPADQTRRAFRLALGRDPTAAELAGATELVRRHGTPALCRALYNANEFLYAP